jgi:hypothetical protein
VANLNHGNIDQLQAQLSQAQQRPPDLGPQPQLSRDLAPPPRRLSASLVVLTVLSGATFLAAAIFSALGIVTVAITELDGPAGMAVAGIAPLLLSVIMLARGFRQVHVLIHGVAAPALMMYSRGRGGYQNNSATTLEGWDRTTTNYTGPYYTSYLRLGLPQGPFCEFKVRGMEYKSGMFVFLPNNPRRRLIPQFTGVPLRPDEHGQWRPLRANEAAARSLLKYGDADSAASTLGMDPRIFGWIVSTLCLAALLGQLVVLALSIVEFVL